MQLVFLSRDPREHHQLVLASGRPANPGFNVVNQISFRVPDLGALRRFHDRLLAEGASEMHPVTHGNAISVYCRDPEGNRLELFMDTPWYCDQPLRETIDLSQSDEAILAQAEAIAKRFPKFMSRAPNGGPRWRAACRKTSVAEAMRMHDVAIVGLGPTGATLANLLGAAGLSVLVLEKEAGIFRCRARSTSTARCCASCRARACASGCWPSRAPASRACISSTARARRC